MSILFCAIFYGVSFAIKKGELIQNPVNTPQKIGEPKIKIVEKECSKKNQKFKFVYI